MENEILTAAGIQSRGSRFVKPPAGTYAVWFDHTDTEGADFMAPGIFRHSVRIELYEPKKDDTAEAALEQVLSARCLEWAKHERIWIQSEQMYQTIYEFDYTEKRRF